MIFRDLIRRWIVRRLLRQRVPPHRRNSAKVSELFSEALALRKQGYDFQIIYTAEQGHHERVKDEIVHTEELRDGNSGYEQIVTVNVYMASGRSYSMSPTYEDNSLHPSFHYPSEDSEYDKWIIDAPETITLIKGDPLNA